MRIKLFSGSSATHALRAGLVFGAVAAGSAAHADIETLHYVSDPYSATASLGASSLPPFVLGATITGSVTLATPLVANMVDQQVTATAYEFIDGVLDEKNTNVDPEPYFQFSTDSAAHITDWLVLAYNQVPMGAVFLSQGFRIAFLEDGIAANTYDVAGEFLCTDHISCSQTADQTARTLEHGTFTTSFAASAPEPASWAMMIVGFGLAGAVLRGRGTALRGKLAMSS